MSEAGCVFCAIVAGETPAEPTTVIDWSSGAPEVMRVGAGDPGRFES